MNNEITVKELVTKVQDLQNEIQDLQKSINTLRGISRQEEPHIPLRTWEADVSKDERPTIKLLFNRYKISSQELEIALDTEVVIVKHPTKDWT